MRGASWSAQQFLELWRWMACASAAGFHLIWAAGCHTALGTDRGATMSSPPRVHDENMIGCLQVESFSWLQLKLPSRHLHLWHLPASSFQRDKQNLQGWLRLERHNDIVPAPRVGQKEPHFGYWRKNTNKARERERAPYKSWTYSSSSSLLCLFFMHLAWQLMFSTETQQKHTPPINIDILRPCYDGHAPKHSGRRDALALQAPLNKLQKACKLREDEGLER